MEGGRGGGSLGREGMRETGRQREGKIPSSERASEKVTWSERLGETEMIGARGTGAARRRAVWRGRRRRRLDNSLRSRA